MVDGLLDLFWWQVILVALAMTHVSIAAITIYLHRCQAHRALDLHPLVSHFFRFWLWLGSGTSTKEWVAVHRYHHARCETEEDPHSPVIHGIDKVLWQGYELYRASANDKDMVQHYSHGTPDDFLENSVYRYKPLGITIMLLIDVLLFGVLGAAVWAVQMVWMPFFAAGVVNGLGHWWGYRSFSSPDAATNIAPWGILIGGEELHNNHHAFPSSAKLSVKWWEFDIGWMYIKLLSYIGLAKVRRVATSPLIDRTTTNIDMDTVKAVILHRMHVLANYAREVVTPVADAEICRNELDCRKLAKQARHLLSTDVSRLDAIGRARLNDILEKSQALATVHQYRQRLQDIWGRRAASQEILLQALQDWCREAEGTGIAALEDFSRSLRGYRPALG